MDKLPTVTVVTPTFNAEKTIARCLTSVRSQTYQPRQHIVVDGCSTDGTLAIARQHRVSYYSEPDGGIYDAMSKGVRRTKGDYVHILNADDVYASPTSLETILLHMLANGLDLCHGQAAHVDAKGRILRIFGRDLAKADLIKKMRVAHPTVVVKRSVYERFGAFSTGFKIAGDHEFLLRVWDKVRVGFVPEVLVHMQIGGMSTNGGNVAQSYRESLAASILHGANPFLSTVRCRYEILKHKVLFSRRYHGVAAEDHPGA